MLQWTEQFTTGSSNLDFQHQTLIDNINDLEKLLAIASPTREDYEFILNTVGFLERYADKHFKCEEQCMESFQCPSRAKNKQAHLDFMALFQKFKQHDHGQGFPREILVTLHETIHQWIMNHILHIDTQLRPFIKG